MDIKLIKTEADYQLALKEIERLMEMDLIPDTPDADRFEVLVTLVETYEAKYHPMGLPDPIEAIKIRMEDTGFSRKDLEPLIGTRGRVSEILNRKRPLTMSMVRRLHETLHIPLEVLIQPYETQEPYSEERVEL